MFNYTGKQLLFDGLLRLGQIIVIGVVIYDSLTGWTYIIQIGLSLYNLNHFLEDWFRVLFAANGAFLHKPFFPHIKNRMTNGNCTL
jgi:hypothetical protein